MNLGWSHQLAGFSETVQGAFDDHHFLTVTSAPQPADFFPGYNRATDWVEERLSPCFGALTLQFDPTTHKRPRKTSRVYPRPAMRQRTSSKAAIDVTTLKNMVCEGDERHVVLSRCVDSDKVCLYWLFWV
jgi:hypothetical protein